MSHEGPPGGKPPKPDLDKVSQKGAKVIDFHTRQTLKPKQIEERFVRDRQAAEAKRAQIIGDPHSEPPTDLDLLTVAQERKVFTWPGMMERARALTGEALDTDVLRLLNNRYHFVGDVDAFMDSAVAKDMDHVRTAHRAVRETNQEYSLCNDAQISIAVVLLEFIRANNYVERMLAGHIFEPLQENKRWNAVLNRYHVTPRQRDDAFSTLNLVGGQSLELTRDPAHQVIDAHQRLAINPLLLRADVRTFLREILQEQAVRWTMHLAPEDIDRVEDRLQNHSGGALMEYMTHLLRVKERQLRGLDTQAARDSIRTRWIQGVVESYRVTQQNLHDKHNNDQYRRRQLEGQLDALPQPSRWPPFLMNQRRQRQEAELHTRRAALQEQIEKLDDEITEDDEDIDPNWHSTM